MLRKPELEKMSPLVSLELESLVDVQAETFRWGRWNRSAGQLKSVAVHSAVVERIVVVVDDLLCCRYCAIRVYQRSA